MVESHVISGLVAKRSELAGQIDYHQKTIKQIKVDMSAIDSAIKVFSPDYDLRTIKSKQQRTKNHFFKNGEGNTLLMDIVRTASPTISTQEIVEEVIKRKGFDDIDRKALTACVFTILKRLQDKKVIREDSRDNNIIQWCNS